MKRVKVIAGNWKMYKTRDDALDFIYKVNNKTPERTKVESVLFVPNIYLRTLVKRQGNLRMGTQNIHFLDEGAYTGETSVPMVENIGATYALIGHSERRKYYNETDKDVNLKLKRLVSSSLIPMVCVGEDLSIREKGQTADFINNQLVQAFKDILEEDAHKVIIAYEPIWAIGTGKTATPEMAEETIKTIREDMKNIYSKNLADSIRILYGGSVKPSNLAELLKGKNIDGALIGGASLDPDSFIEMLEIGEKAK